MVPDRTIPFYNVILRCDVPPDALPVPEDGWRLRTYREGDEQAWARLECEMGDFDSAEDAERYFRAAYCGESTLDIRKRAVFAVSPGGEVVGSCIAWRDTKGTGSAASLHWLAVSPAWQGRHIGKALCREVLRIFASKGEFPVYIHTQPWSWKAILLYIRQGFRLQKTDSFSHYENQYEQAMEVLREILPEGPYRELLQSAE